jgi:hypothetical protein
VTVEALASYGPLAQSAIPDLIKALRDENSGEENGLAMVFSLRRKERQYQMWNVQLKTD